MSRVDPAIDLAGFARPLDAPPRRRLLPIVVLALLVLGFAALVVEGLRGRVGSRTSVSVVRPVAAGATGAVAGAADRVLVQAAGWVEPDPYPYFAAALVEGVVEAVLVQEADVVAAGDPVARLVDEDARIADALAAAELARAEAGVEVAAARARIASERFTAALEVTEAAERAQARLVAKLAEAEHRRAAVAEGEAEVALADGELEVQRELAARHAAGTRQVEIAEARLVGARARLRILLANAAAAEADVAEAEAMDVRARAEREGRFADRLERDVAVAELDAARAEEQRARAERARAALALERTIVRAPADGVVLERLAAPGQGLEAGMAVCSLYDPAAVRVRVDVPQGEVAKLAVGRRAEVRNEARAGRSYAGEVVRIVHRADIQKVTLEAQVRVEEPDALLRPDMLVQVRFFGGDDAVDAPADRGTVLLVPRRVVSDGAVWLVDADGRARRRTIRTGAVRGDAIEVLDGLTLADRLVDAGREGLSEGTRVDVGGAR